MAQRLLGVEHPAGEHEVAHQAVSAHLEEAGRAPGVGDEPVGELGQAELGVVGGDPQVAQEGAFEHAADAPALDRAHDRHLGRQEVPLGHAVAVLDVVVVALTRRPVAQLRHVTARRERTALGPPEDAVDVARSPISSHASQSSSSITSLIAFRRSGRSSVSTATWPS